MEQVTNTFNLFVDSSRGIQAGNSGVDYSIDLASVGIHAGDGDYIRMQLNNFCMAKTFPDVNAFNNKLKLYMKNIHDEEFHADIEIPMGNYNTIRHIAEALANKVKTALEGFGFVGPETAPGSNQFDDIGITDITPVDNDTDFNGYGDNTISFEIHAGNTCKDWKLICDETESDSYALIGADRRPSGDNTTSIYPAGTPSKTYLFTFLYPAQRSTMPYLYLRANLPNTNVETYGMNSTASTNQHDTTPSDILGRIPVSTEWCKYSANMDREFFVNTKQKSLTHLRLRVTDGRNRLLSTWGGDMKPNQAKTGNLSFTAVLRIDVIKHKTVHHLETIPYQPSVPDRFSSNLLTHFKNGRDDFGRSPGY